MKLDDFGRQENVLLSRATDMDKILYAEARGQLYEARMRRQYALDTLQHINSHMLRGFALANLEDNL